MLIAALTTLEGVDQRLSVGEQAGKQGNKRRIARIAGGYACVTHQAAAFGAQHRGATKQGAKAGVVQHQQFRQGDPCPKNRLICHSERVGPGKYVAA